MMTLEQTKIYPLVTIMIPTYGQEDIILDAIDSALAQDYPNLEIIVADDASPDKTDEKIATRMDPRLRYHRNIINLGRVGNYRNTLYNLAKGDWVVNLDGDDYYIDTGFISAAVDMALSDPEILIVAARQCKEDACRNILSQIPANRLFLGVEVFLQLHNPVYRFNHMSTLYHRKSAIACDFYRYDVLSSDWESLFRLALRGKVAYLDRVVGVWRFSYKNASRSTDWKMLLKNYSIWDSICMAAITADVPVQEVRKIKNNMLFLFTCSGLYKLITSGQMRDALRFFLAAGSIETQDKFRIKFFYKALFKLVPFSKLFLRKLLNNRKNLRRNILKK